MSLRIHFIAIGGSAMHALALEAKRLGHNVSGSDDEIYEPAKSALAAGGILPDKTGWDAGRINSELDIVVLGMHAKADNPELLRAKELNVLVLSYPEFVYSLTEDMHRIVVAGSHGKTTVTSMIMHVLQTNGIRFNYLVGAKVPGFTNSVRLDADQHLIVIEGDEYLASEVTRVPKFLQYRHHIGVVTGVAWDHMNVFPTIEQYVRQFDHFADNTPKGGSLIYNEDDPIASVICRKPRADVSVDGYTLQPYTQTTDGWAMVDAEGNQQPVGFFGKHNFYNVSAARHVCHKIGIADADFDAAIATYTGASKRLERIPAANNQFAYRDFAHAPSKVSATVDAFLERHAGQPTRGVFELHTFSSLNPAFIPQYVGSLDGLDAAAVYYDPAVSIKKGLGAFNEQDLRNAFKRDDLVVLTTPDALQAFMLGGTPRESHLYMSSGTFGGADLSSYYA